MGFISNNSGFNDTCILAFYDKSVIANLTKKKK